MRYRDLDTLEDFRSVVELEKRVWGYTDAEDVVPVPILAVNVKRGGVLIGAFNDAGEMVGFVYSLPGIRHQRPIQWSHMLGVSEDYRGTGLGFQLKLEQRLRTLQMGMDLVEWTFDPLQALNAHLNFHKLGVVVAEYEENIYGESSSPLHSGTPTDRFVAEWWIRTARVERRIAAKSRAADGVHDVPDAVVNVTGRSGEWMTCETVDLSCTSPQLRVEIPVGFGDMQTREPELARAWRAATRDMFVTYFGRGYRAVEFILDRASGRGWYLLVRESSEAENGDTSPAATRDFGLQARADGGGTRSGRRRGCS